MSFFWYHNLINMVLRQGESLTYLRWFYPEHIDTEYAKLSIKFFSSIKAKRCSAKFDGTCL